MPSAEMREVYSWARRQGIDPCSLDGLRPEIQDLVRLEADALMQIGALCDRAYELATEIDQELTTRGDALDALLDGVDECCDLDVGECCDLERGGESNDAEAGEDHNQEVDYERNQWAAQALFEKAHWAEQEVLHDMRGRIPKSVGPQ